MLGSKLTWAAGGLLVLVAVAGVGVGRWTAPEVEAGDRKRPAAEEANPADEPVAAAEGKPGPARPTEERKPAGKAREFVVTRPTGTWVREVPGLGRATLRFEEDRLYAVGELAMDGGRMTLSVEADYAINKESVVYGVVTGIECDDPEEGLEFELILTGQPFAFRFRADGDTLTVKDVKGAGYGLDGGEEPDEVVLLLSGRYVAADGNRPAPAPRAPVKPAARPRKGATLSGLTRPRNQYAGDPVVRANQLLNQSEDHRSVREKWRQFWFQDAPRHMTPERIHGGIMDPFRTP